MYTNHSVNMKIRGTVPFLKQPLPILLTLSFSCEKCEPHFLRFWRSSKNQLPFTKREEAYHHNGFVATHALWHMIYSYTLLVPMNQRVLNKQSKERNSLVHWYQQCVTVHHVSKCISCHKAIAVITGRARCFHGYIYITPILLL